MITAHLVSHQVQSNSTEAFAMYEKSQFGEKDADQIIYMPIEVIFLMKRKRLVLLKGNKQLSIDQALNVLKKLDPRIALKIPVYEDLRKKGFVLKTGLKFGGDFRVYAPGTKAGQQHAKWILVCYKETQKVDWHEFSSKNRVAHSTNKTLLVALVDQENKPNYYETSWKGVR